ncbi:corazonin [Cochliomyia hominivorax]
MLRIVIFPLFIFLFSMACMGQTFQYSRGWTNGKRANTATTLNNLFHKDDDGMPELFEVQDLNEKRLERCILQLQRFIKNPLLLHTTAAALAMNPSLSANQNGNNNNNNNNPYGRNHQSNELFEELGTAGGAIIDTNDYAKH